MDLYEAIEKRKTVRRWEDKEVPEEVLKKILSAGLAAPTNDHLRNWDFIVTKDPKEKETALQFVKEWTDKFGGMDTSSMDGGKVRQNMYTYAFPRQYTMLINAPWLVIPLFKGNPLHAEYINQMSHLASIWCVIENIFLACAAEGLGTAIRIPVEEEGRKVRETLGVPEGWLMPCYLGIGVPAEEPEIVQHDYTAEEKMHYGKW